MTTPSIQNQKALELTGHKITMRNNLETITLDYTPSTFQHPGIGTYVIQWLVNASTRPKRVAMRMNPARVPVLEGKPRLRSTERFYILKEKRR
jgi:hypothetical protein